MTRISKRLANTLLCGMIAVFLFAVPMAAHGAALDPLFPTSGGNETLAACYEKGNYSLYHVIRLIYYIMQWVWGLSGSLALLMFVWGGVLWLISAGSDQRVTEGRTTLINAVIGIIIIFGSWIFINMIVGALVSGNAAGKAQIFGVDWSKYEDQACLEVQKLKYGEGRCMAAAEAEKLCNTLETAAQSGNTAAACANGKKHRHVPCVDNNNKVIDDDTKKRCICDP